MLVFERDTPFCLTGAVYQAELDGELIYSYWRYTARKGQTLKMVRAVQGMYGYVCVAGGFDVPEVMGSRSTDLKVGFGGHQGRMLQKAIISPSAKVRRNCPKSALPRYRLPIPSTLFLLSEYAAFSEKGRLNLERETWTLQSDSNRMGYRFDGQPLTLSQPLEMLSHAVQAGTVQVPPGGKPIILLADAQTICGYPKIATVAAADLGRLAQVRFGSKVKFKIIGLKEATALRRKNQAYLNQIRRITHEAG